MSLTKDLIAGVKIRKLSMLPDERGYLMEMLRIDWPEFERFAQAYITGCYPGVIKAWHYHRLQTDHFVCLSGMAKVVLHDARPDSPTHNFTNEFHMGLLNPMLLKIPALVYHGFTAEGGQPAVIMNFPTELYNYTQPDEYRLAHDDPTIPYNWSLRHG